MIANLTKFTLAGLLLICLATPAMPEGYMHPARAYKLAEHHPKAITGTRPADWSIGDLTFSGVSQKVADLTWEEQYILGGLDSKSVPPGVETLPWHMLVTNAARKLDELYGSIPARLTKEELLKIPQCQYWDDAQFEYYRNPFTGDWPLLQQADFSPGDLYMRKLTQGEIKHFAGLDKHLKGVWIDGYDTPLRWDEEVPVEVCGSIYYVRIYGYEQPLFEGFDYFYKEL